MRLSIGFSFLLVVIAFVQSKPLFNGANDFNAVINQFASQNNLANQFNGLAEQVANALSSGQLQAIGQQVFQLVQNVLNGQVDANAAASQFLSQVQQILGSNSQLYNTVANAVQQLLNLSGAGLTRPTLNRGYQVEDLQNLLDQYPQFAGLVNQGAAIASQVLPLFSSAQLQFLQKLVLQVANQVVSGQLSVYAAANQLLGIVQPVLASNTDLLNEVQSFVQQIVDAAQTIRPKFISGLTRPVLPSVDNLLPTVNQFQLGNLQGLLSQYSQFSDLANQAAELARRVVAAVSPAQLQSLVNLARELAQQVVSGQLSVSAAANQLLGEVQSLLASDANLLNDVQSFVQQVVSVAQSVLSNFSTRFALPSPADLSNLANQFQLGNLQGLLSQNPQVAGLVNQAAELARRVVAAVSPAQLQSLVNLARQLAQQVVSGQLSVSAAANQLSGAAQPLLSANANLLNDVQSFVQQVVSVAQSVLPNFSTRFALPSPADLLTFTNQFQLGDLQGFLAQLPQYAGLVNQVVSLVQNVLNGQVDANAAASQFLSQVQQLLGSNTELYNAVANAVQQLLTLSGAGLTRPVLNRNLQLSDLEAIVSQYPEYAALAAPFASLAQQVVAALTQDQLASLEATLLNLAENVINGQLDPNVAAGQLLSEIQQYLGSNPQLYGAIANAVQQLVNLGQGY